MTISTLAQRYLVDLVPLVLVMAAPGVWWWAGRAQRWPRWLRRVSLVGMGVLMVVGTWTQLGLALQARAFSILPTREQLLETARFQYELDDRLFGGSPPEVTLLLGPELPESAEDGQLVVLGDCAGVYRFDGYSWGALEWEGGAGRRVVLEGPVPGGTTALATGAGWSLDVVPDAAGLTATVVYRSEGQPDLPSESFAIEGDELVLDVVADPAVGSVAVDVAGAPRARRVVRGVVGPHPRSRVGRGGGPCGALPVRSSSGCRTRTEGPTAVPSRAGLLGRAGTDERREWVVWLISTTLGHLVLAIRSRRW